MMWCLLWLSDYVVKSADWWNLIFNEQKKKFLVWTVKMVHRIWEFIQKLHFLVLRTFTGWSAKEVFAMKITKEQKKILAMAYAMYKIKL